MAPVCADPAFDERRYIIMKFSSHLFDRARGAYINPQEPESVRLLARLAWRGGLLGAALSSLLGVVYGIYTLFGALAFPEGPSASPRTVPASTLNKANLEQVLQNFHTRDAQFEAAKGAPPAAVDPSR